jgi:hypothetical protein
MLLSRLMLLLMCLTPLASLVVSSLALAALKRVSRRPSWTERLARPPFYFVALPVAALIVGMQTLVYAVNYFVAGSEVADDWVNFFGYGMFLLGSAQLFLFSSYSFAPFGYLFLAALTFSGFMLARVLSDDRDWAEPAEQTRRRLEAIALLSAFVLAWAGGWYVVGFAWLAVWR